MSDYNAYDAFHESLNATGVLSPEYKSTLSAILGKAMEQARDRGRAEGKQAADHARRVLDENRRIIADLEQRLRLLERAAVEDEQEIETLQAALEDEDAFIHAMPAYLSERRARTDGYNEALPAEREAIKLARSRGVVTNGLDCLARRYCMSGLDVASLRELGALAFVLARRKDDD